MGPFHFRNGPVDAVNQDLTDKTGDALSVKLMAVAARQSMAPGGVGEWKPRHSWRHYLEICLPYLLALLFLALALYGVDKTEIIDTDAARHAMNGAFIYDLIRTGNLLHPIAYGKAYYSRLPALSVPFHPPLFPAIEAVFFAVFGVKLFTARLVVALCVAASAILLYRLVLATLGRPILAACVTVSSLSLWTSQYVARDVMLEYPALVFTLAALYCARDIRESYSLRRAIPFALFAAAALWTKQHTVFLGAVPFFEAAMARRWRRFLELPLWISSALYGIAVLAIIWFSRLFHGTGIDQISTSSRDVYYILTSTLPHYFYWIKEDLRGMPGVLLVCAVGVYFCGIRRRDTEKPRLALFVAWILTAVAVLVDLGPVSPRYLFFIWPAVTTIGFAWLYYGSLWFWGERWAAFVAGAFAVGFFVAGFGIPFDFLRGPAAAARVVVEGKPTRVLYAGDADGNFIFAVRELDPNRQTTVIPAVKLPRNLLQSSDVAKLRRWYGIQWVVFENTPAPHPWSGFQATLPAVSKLERSFPLQSSRYRWRQGSLDVYRLAPTTDPPDGVLRLSVPRGQEEITSKP